MKATFIIVMSGLLGCSAATNTPKSAEISVDEAKQKAVAMVPGTVTEAMPHDEDGDVHHWVVHVKVANGALVIVELDRNDGSLDQIKGEQGPFDYDFPAPVAGYLTFGQAKTKALAINAGTVEVWELDVAKSQYEFYVRDANTRLWEIKLVADKGDLKSVEEKDRPD